MITSTRSRRRRPLAALLVGALAVGLLGACTREGKKDTPKISTVGVLKAAELGTGTWAGPYADFEDAHGRSRVILCPELNTLLYPVLLSPPLARNSVVWADGDTAVESSAYLFDANSSPPDDLTRTAEGAESCAQLAPTGGGDATLHSFTIDHVDGAIVLRENNRWAATDWIIETAFRRIGGTIVTVNVSYPAGTADPPAVLDLLAKAVTDSAELATIATPAAGSGTPSP